MTLPGYPWLGSLSERFCSPHRSHSQQTHQLLCFPSCSQGTRGRWEAQRTQASGQDPPEPSYGRRTHTLHALPAFPAGHCQRLSLVVCPCHRALGRPPLAPSNCPCPPKEGTSGIPVSLAGMGRVSCTGAKAPRPLWPGPRGQTVGAMPSYRGGSVSSFRRREPGEPGQRAAWGRTEGPPGLPCNKERPFTQPFMPGYFAHWLHPIQQPVGWRGGLLTHLPFPVPANKSIAKPSSWKQVSLLFTKQWDFALASALPCFAHSSTAARGQR